MYVIETPEETIAMKVPVRYISNNENIFWKSRHDLRKITIEEKVKHMTALRSTFREYNESDFQDIHPMIISGPDYDNNTCHVDTEIVLLCVANSYDNIRDTWPDEFKSIVGQMSFFLCERLSGKGKNFKTMFKKMK